MPGGVSGSHREIGISAAVEWKVHFPFYCWMLSNLNLPGQPQALFQGSCLCLDQSRSFRRYGFKVAVHQRIQLLIPLLGGGHSVLVLAGTSRVTEVSPHESLSQV